MSELSENWNDQWKKWINENPGMSEPPRAEVIGVQFGIFSSDEIEALSAVEVKVPVTCKTGVVQRDGVTDSRLGTTQRAMLCGTCGCDHIQCASGHSGHISLSLPVPNGEYLGTIHKILESVCFNCCKLLIPSDFPSFPDITAIQNDKDRLKRINAVCKKREYCEMWYHTKRRRKVLYRCKRRGTSYEDEEQKLNEEEQDMRDNGEHVPDELDMEHLTVDEILAMNIGCNRRQPIWIKDDGIILRPVFEVTEDDRLLYENDVKMNDLIENSMTLGCESLNANIQTLRQELPIEDFHHFISTLVTAVIRADNNINGSRERGIMYVHDNIECMSMTDLQDIMDRYPPDYKYSPKCKVPVMTPNDLVRIMDNISDEDTLLLGMNPTYSKPVNLIWQNLYVSPVNIRPSKIGRSGNNRCQNEDDITLRLKAIERFNVTLSKTMKKSPECVNIARYSYKGVEFNSLNEAFSHDFEETGRKKPKVKPTSVYTAYEKLYRSIISYQNNKLKGKNVTQYGKEKKSIHCRFRGQKKNRVRGDVMGKRMDYVCRTVITPNPSMHIHDVGVPQWICMKLSFPETVQDYNVKYLTSLVRRGPNVYPGANFIEYPDGRIDNLDSRNRHIVELTHGMVVRRHLVNGDYVLMNRQPSLHKPSIMGHRILVIPETKPSERVNTLELHLSVTPAYNADFDGDEMNMLVLQTYEARAEAMEIMLVDHNILKDDVPIVQFVQNSVVSAYILTDKSTLVRKDHASQMLLSHMQFEQINRLPWNEFEPTIGKDGEQYFTGQQVFSCILPDDFQMKSGDVIVRRGVMEKGQWTKASLNKQGGLIHVMVRDYGDQYTADFITGTYNMLSFFSVSIQGMTVAIDDCHVPSDILGTRDINQRAKKYFNSFKNHSVKSSNIDSEQRERNMCMVADRMRDAVSQRAVQYFDDYTEQTSIRNGMRDLIDSGAKGNPTNLGQSTGCIGQQRNHKSTRFPETTCHYNHPDSDQLEAHGMISSNFMNGMNSMEEFFHLCASRSGLVDTSVKTADTGYMQRRISKSLEDMIVDAGGRVVNSTKEIIQLRYGGDGFLPSSLEKDTLRMFPSDHHWKSIYPGVGEDELKEIGNVRDVILSILSRHKDQERFLVVFTPIHIGRCIERTVQRYTNDKSRPLLDSEIREWTLDLWNRKLTETCINNPKLRLYFMDYLSTSNLRKSKVTKHMLRYLENEIITRIDEASVPYGEMVGQYAAQSIGEPLTQLTLDSFHESGKMSTLTSGVPRVKEIINASEKLNTPSMNIHLKNKSTPIEKVNQLGATLVQKFAADYIESYEMNPDRTKYRERLAMFERATVITYPEMFGIEDEDEEDEEDENITVVVESKNTELPSVIEEEEEEEDEEECDEEDDECDEEEDDDNEESDDEEEECEESEDEDEDIEDLCNDTEEDEGEMDPSVFKEDENHFLLVIHLKSIPITIEEFTLRCKLHCSIDTLGWAFGRYDDDRYWIAVAGAIHDVGLCKWISSMGMFGFDVKLVEDLLIEHIGNCTAHGIKGINNYFVVESSYASIDEANGTMKWLPTHHIVTDGTNMKQIIQLPWVDITRSSTNDILETEKLFGIDAAKSMIHNELLDVMSSSGASVRSRHISLLPHRMTHRGKVVSTTYSGICLPGTSVLRNASFEKPLDTFLNGAFKGDKDTVTGMTECVVLNRLLQGGTGAVKTLKKTIQPNEYILDANRRKKFKCISEIQPADNEWLNELRQKPKVLDIPKVVPLSITSKRNNKSKRGLGMTSASRRRKRALMGNNEDDISLKKKYNSRTITTTAVSTPNPPTKTIRVHIPTVPKFKRGLQFKPFTLKTTTNINNNNNNKIPKFKIGKIFKPFNYQYK